MYERIQGDMELLNYPSCLLVFDNYLSPPTAPRKTSRRVSKMCVMLRKFSDLKLSCKVEPKTNIESFPGVFLNHLVQSWGAA